jgi:hypothetical protein
MKEENFKLENIDLEDISNFLLKPLGRRILVWIFTMQFKIVFINSRKSN